MISGDSERSTSPFDVILKWSEESERPLWQRDALRRIVTSGSLTNDDLSELLAICKKEHGIDASEKPSPNPSPLSKSHDPAGEDGIASVALTRLSRVQNVGSLLKDQEIIFGNAPGLTVIYGENGAGKSGYARVLKKACRARGTPQDIKPDAFTTHAPTPASASIECRVGSEEFIVDWVDGTTTDPRLGNIFVFDSFSARVHVNEHGPASFKPQGLDVLPKLAIACDKITAVLQDEIDGITTENERTSQGWRKLRPDSPIGKLLNTLSAATKRTAIDSAAFYSEANETRLAELTAALNANPKIKAADTRAAAKRIRDFAETAKSRATSVDETTMQGLSDAINDASVTIKAANLAAGPELKIDDLPGSCNEVWRKLWNAARDYSTAFAYPEADFPNLETDARCVLCQQELQAGGVERLSRFNRFVADETRKRADAASAKVSQLGQSASTLGFLSAEAETIRTDLERESHGLFTSVHAFAKSVDARIAHAQSCLNESEWSEPPALSASPLNDLFTIAEALTTRAAAEADLADPGKKQEAETERDDLADKKWLDEKKDEVKLQIRRLAQIAILKNCQADCKTNKITIKSSELDEVYITSAFCAAFNSELRELELTTLPVKLEDIKGAKGERHFAIKIEGAPSAKVSEIASEGEHRCIALAAFFAELSQSSHRSTLVFDDPISSLDHKRREAISTRLVKEAEHRQVVVFTHDLAFVCDLNSAASGRIVEIHYQHVERLAGKPGRVIGDIFWDGKNCKTQLKELREELNYVTTVHGTQGDSEYRQAVLPLISRLRGACERIIEECLLYGIVRRHQSKISVGKSHHIAIVTSAQWRAIQNVWNQCSDLIDSHAPSPGRPTNLPLPEKLKTWLGEVEETVKAVNTARSSNSELKVFSPVPITS